MEIGDNFRRDPPSPLGSPSCHLINQERNQACRQGSGHVPTALGEALSPAVTSERDGLIGLAPSGFNSSTTSYKDGSRGVWLLDVIFCLRTTPLGHFVEMIAN
jgi:hypothetical protein